MTMVQPNSVSARASNRQRRRDAWASVLEPYPPMCPVVVTIVTHTLPAAARKTLERLFLTDKDVRRPLEVRASHFHTQTKRRGGRTWTKRPNALRPELRVHDFANLKLTPEARRALGSVQTFVRLERSAASLESQASDKPAGRDPADADRAGEAGRVDATPCVCRRGDKQAMVTEMMSRRRTAAAQRSSPIFVLTSVADEVATIDRQVKPTIRERVLHTSLVEHPQRRRLAEMIDAHEVTDVYLDISGDDAFEPETLLTFATRLHRMIASLGALTHPLVVGPVARRERGLRRSLALVQVRTTAYDFDHYCDNVHNRRASAKRAADERRRG